MEPYATTCLPSDAFHAIPTHGFGLLVLLCAEAMQRSDFAFVKFFAPWCPHSQKVARLWEDLAESFENAPRFQVASVDCADDRPMGGKAICARFGVDTLPTFLYFLPGDPTGAVYEGEREIGVFREFATLLSAMCVVSRLDGCTDAQKTDLKPYLSMPITRLRSQVVTFEMDMAKLREELARAESEYELARTSSELKRNEANVKAAQDLRKQVEAAQGHVDALENDLGQGYRMAKSVLLFRSHEQHVLGSGWVPRSTSSWGSLSSRSSSRSSRYDLKDEV